MDTPCFNSSSFVPSGAETNFGNLARNAIYGPHYDDVDMSLYKRFALGERMHLQLGLTAADLF